MRAEARDQETKSENDQHKEESKIKGYLKQCLWIYIYKIQ